MVKVYVSSTFNDLKDYRAQVRLSLRRMGYEDVAMEYYGAIDERPIDRCLQDVALCDVYVGIFAWRYGFIPEGYDHSITELEYRCAVMNGKSCLIFLVEESASWPFNQIEMSAMDSIQSLRSRLEKEHIVSYFGNADTLAARVVEALTAWLQEGHREGPAITSRWESYRQAVVEAYQWVSLSVIAGTRQDPFRIPLTQVFVPQTASRGIPPFELPEEVLQQRRAHFNVKVVGGNELEDQGINPGLAENVLDILGRESLQVFLGGPGSGKTTIFYYAMLNLCDVQREEQHFRHLNNNPIPLLIELRKYVLSHAPDFVSYLVSNLQTFFNVEIAHHEIDSLLKQANRAVVLFDGLDEIFNPVERQHVVEQFKSFVRKYPQTRIVVSSRIAGYDRFELDLVSFAHYTLLDFGLLQIKLFVFRWYQFYALDSDTRTSEGLVQRIIDNSRLLELAGNPLLLTMMAIIFKHQDLPEQRWQLYERCSQVLLEHWELKRKAISLDEQGLDIKLRAPQKAEILQLVAMYMLKRSAPNCEINVIAFHPLIDILAEYLRDKYDKSVGEAAAIAESILGHLRERTYILAEIGQDLFGFVHRTFMEYFAACFCRSEFNARRADYDWLTRDIFGSYWQQGEWQEVLFLLMAMLSDQGSPLQEVTDFLCTEFAMTAPHNIVFAARCVAEANTIEDKISARKLLGQLTTAISWYALHPQREPDMTYLEIGLVAFSRLALMLDVPANAIEDIKKLEGSSSVRAQLVAWQMNYGLRKRRDQLQFALNALKSPHEAVRRGAIATLERDWPQLPEVENALLDLVSLDTNTRVRQAALETLEHNFGKSERILRAIQARVRDESAYTHVIWLIEFLAKNWKDNRLALALLLHLTGLKPKASYDYDYERVSAFAAATIAENWQGQSNLTGYLQQIVQLELDSQIRSTALLALVSGWADSLGTLDFICELCKADSSPEIRRHAIQALAERYKAHRKVHELLRWIAVHDIEPNFRRIALQAIATGEQNSTDVYDIVRHSGVADPAPIVRQTAIELLGEHWHGMSHSLQLLQERAMSDNEPTVRVSALKMIAEKWFTDPSTYSVMCDRVANDSAPSVRWISLMLLANYLLDLRSIDLEYPMLRRFNQEFSHPAVANSLSERWREHPDTLKLLRDCATQDPDPRIRATAVQMLYRGWQSDPEIQELMFNQAFSDTDSYVKTVIANHFGQMRS
jgi:hypothetical protein